MCPAVGERIKWEDEDKRTILIKEGEIIIPEKLATGMKIKKGDAVVLVAHNEEGSVNGLNFSVGGIVVDVLGP